MEQPARAPSVALTQLERRKGASVRFSNISVDLKEKRVLHGVDGHVAPGELLAVMGPSGSGKTTLFNVLASRVEMASGEVLLDDQPLCKRLRRQMCYVLQNDLLFPYLTLYETLQYAALLRLPKEMSVERKMAAVEEVMDVLGVRNCRDTIIGNERQRGLSGGERKRASIAQELLANPRLLVMDEPTSGLDSHIAHSLLCTIQDLALTQGRTIITSIHQPSSQIFHLFSKLLLLAKGRVVYFGPGCEAVAFFSRLGYECPMNYNPADYLLDVISNEDAVQRVSEARKTNEGAESGMPSDRQTDFTEALLGDYDAPPPANESRAITRHDTATSLVVVALTSAAGASERPAERTCASVEEGEVPRKPAAGADDDEDDDDGGHTWPSSFRTQLSVLTRRALKNGSGDVLSVINFVQVGILVAISSLVWFRVPKAEAHIRDITGYLFFIAVYFGFQPIVLASGSFLVERSIINRERSSGYYRLSSYFLAKTITDVPLICVLPTFYLAVTFPITGLGGFVQFCLLWVFLMLGVLVSQSFGQFIGSLAPTFPRAIVTATTLMISFLLGGGFYVTEFSPSLAWLRYLSYINYMYNAFALVIFDSTATYRCDPDKLGSPYAQCRLDPVNATISGAEIRRELGASQYALGWLAAVLIGVSLTLRVATYAIMRWLRKPTVQ